MDSVDRENRVKRMKMRSWRRGTKEMDLILGPYADAHLAGMDGPALDQFEAVLAESDSDLFPWIIGANPVPSRLAALLRSISEYSRSRPRSF